jgi:uncharacterized protein involved in response to NO
MSLGDIAVIRSSLPSPRPTSAALFSLGLRPFFLFAAGWAALAVPIWILAYAFGDGRIGGLDGRTWHIHEMLFGFLPGVMAGFLLTAVPNWTGRLPVSGAALNGLVGLWAAGRVASFAFGPLAIPGAVTDSLFLIVFAAVIWREVLAGRNLRNLPVCILVTLFALANVAFHLGAVWPVAADVAQRAAIATAAMMIALIGGRITPSFTRNWIAANHAGAEPRTFGFLDRGTLGLSLVALAAWVAFPWSAVAGAALLGAGVLTAIRLSGWRGVAARSEPLVWILHVGYAALALGLGLLGASTLAPELVPLPAGVHALTAGAIGIMTLAVMTRASLGHTGRARTAGPGVLAIYVLIIAGAVLRVVAAFWVASQTPLLIVSATLWSGSFAAFVAILGPMLVSPKPVVSPR